VQRYRSPRCPLCLTKAKPPLWQYGHLAPGGSGCSLMSHSLLVSLDGQHFRQKRPMWTVGICTTSGTSPQRLHRRLLSIIRSRYTLAARKPGHPWFSALGDFFRLCGSNLGWRAGVIPIVARQSFRNLLRRELAVIFRMQYLGWRTRVRDHRFISSLLSEHARAYQPCWMGSAVPYCSETVRYFAALTENRPLRRVA